ncbi:MAG: hypothetical protein DRP11_01450 [Candidatus Aenigmatarchaeota archaeon]|nr:MAG: hypothetical protein DRP11_01450 [Candidatus Aenigmarchaeota archaeon]
MKTYQPPAPAPQPSPQEVQLRKELSDTITDIIFDAQDVGFELAMLECPNRDKCPLVQKTRELIKKVRKLVEIQRKMPRP